MNHEPTALPSPTRQRWQPLRGGLLNLYRYDYEEFWYEDGHLLLRGNNGTGKSRVLALQLPFLLDGEVSPHRLEPDGDPAKRVEWNLLMGRYSDRLGYTWIEFGRLSDEDDDVEPGTPLYLTLGCGLSAVEGRGLVSRWFFISDLRVGQNLFLEGTANEALVRPRLVEMLGDRGRVFTTAAEYRDAVDRALFHLGRARYESLVNLLIQLRQPQLSRKLDEGKLSAALSDALPPLSPTVLADVAESFRTLESDRQGLEDLKHAGSGVDVFLRGYRRYAQIAARRRAEEVRATHSAYDHTQRRLRAAQETSERAERRLAEVTLELERLEEAGHGARAEVRTLEARPEMRDKQALDAAHRRAEERRRERDRAQGESERAETARRTSEEHHRQVSSRADQIWSDLETTLETTAAEASRGELLEDHRRNLERLGLPEVDDPARLDAVAARLEEVTVRRERGVRHVRALGARVETARQALTAAREHHDERSTEVDDARERQQEASRAHDQAVEALLGAWASWAADLEELAPPSAGELDEALRVWSRQGEGEGPLTAALRDAERRATETLARLRAGVEEQRRAEDDELARKMLEEKELREGVHRPPSPPHTRNPEGRRDRPGAPLWQVCDFAPDLDQARQAGLEAALEAAGLLDAWITPEGQLLDPEDHDTVLLAGGQATPERNLHEVLQPQIDGEDPQAATLTEGTVHAVLSIIGLGADQGEVWVCDDGRFRVGPLHGRWGKEAPQHLGAGARAAERRRRLLRLAEEIAAIEGRIAALDAELKTLQERRARVQGEATSAPEETPIREAAATLNAATSAVHRARERLVEAERRLAVRRRELETAQGDLTAAAEDLGLTEHLDRLPELAEALTTYHRSLAALWPTVRNHLAARSAALDAAERLKEATESLARSQGHFQLRQRELHEAEVERETLQNTLGAGVEEILARLASARARTETLEAERRRADEQRGDLRVERAGAESDIRAEQNTLERDQAERQTAFTGLGHCVQAGLLRIAVPDLDTTDFEQWSATRTVEAARRLEESLSDVDSDDAAWGRQQRDVSSRLETLRATLLPYGYDPELSMPDDLMVITVTFQGRQHPLDSFRAALGVEVEARDRVLAEREREVLENHLLGEVAQHLHENLRAAALWVQEMNGELEDRPMSTGMTLRFVWQPESEEMVAGLAKARQLLMKEHGIWSPAERKAVGEFLHGRIERERAENDLGTWQDHLTTALDYRAWHRFGVERQQDGQWRRLTRRSHGTGSGGEKAIALTVPQFAAAAAHYRTAHPNAPRLILLDEAFVGVDADMRSKCMGLLQTFDLDFLMTSEREWGCYPTLPGLAIYQLATRQGIDAVSVSRWVWNGRERRRDVHMLPPSRTPPPVSDEPALPFGDEG